MTTNPVAYAIAPLLSVRSGKRALEFYKEAFGAVETFKVEDPGGAIVATLSVNGAEFWVADESPEHKNFSPESLGGGSVRMILTVPDPDAMFARAIAAGATADCPGREQLRLAARPPRRSVRASLGDRPPARENHSLEP